MEEKLISKLLDKETYKKIDHVIFLRNDTSRTIIQDPEKIFFLKFMPNGVVLQLPAKSCVEGHMVSLFIFKRIYLKKKIKLDLQGSPKIPGLIEMVGHVKEIVPIDDLGNSAAEIHFGQFDEDEWSKMLDEYDKQQDKINKLRKR